MGGLPSGKLLLIHGQIFPYGLTVQAQAFSNLRLVEPLGLKFSYFIPHILSVFQISAHDFHKMMSVCFEPAKIGIHFPVKVRHSFFPFFADKITVYRSGRTLPALCGIIGSMVLIQEPAAAGIYAGFPLPFPLPARTSLPTLIIALGVGYTEVSFHRTFLSVLYETPTCSALRFS